MLCPNCNAAIREAEELCPVCKTDLTDVLSARYQPDLLYNEALDLMKQQRWSEACDLLGLAHDMRHNDTGILKLRVRAEYHAENLKRAVELAVDLIDLDDSEENQQLLEQISEEYDKAQSSGNILIRQELSRQNDRLSGLLDRMERSLGVPETKQAPAEAAAPPVAPTAESTASDSPSKEIPTEKAEFLSKGRQSPLRSRMPSFSDLFGNSVKGGKP